MFTNHPTPNYFALSAREIEAEGREREKRLTLEQAIEKEMHTTKARKGFLAALATILFS
jgi:hypothetical protein